MTWDPEHPPDDWHRDRRRWHTTQGLRAILVTVWFLCSVAALTLA